MLLKEKTEQRTRLLLSDRVSLTSPDICAKVKSGIMEGNAAAATSPAVEEKEEGNP